MKIISLWNWTPGESKYFHCMRWKYNRGIRMVDEKRHEKATRQFRLSIKGHENSTRKQTIFILWTNVKRINIE